MAAMTKCGWSPAFITMVRQFHDKMMAHVLDNGKISKDFLVNTGMKQGCVVAPTLLSMMLSAMLLDAFLQGDAGVEI